MWKEITPTTRRSASGHLDEGLKGVERTRRLRSHVAGVERPAGFVGTHLPRDEQLARTAGAAGSARVPVEAVGLDSGPADPRALLTADRSRAPAQCNRSVLGL